MKMPGRLSHWLPVAAAILVFTGYALAQTEGSGASAPPTGGGGGQRGTPPRPSEPGPTTAPIPRQLPQPQEAPQFERPLFLRGNVILDDGSAAPPNIMIEQVCTGTARPVTYTDAKGHFSFEAGGPPRGFVPDASYSGSAAQIGFGDGGRTSSMSGMGVSGGRSLLGCELRASLPGFRSDSVSLSDRGIFDSDVGTIVLHRIAEVKGYTISLTTAMAPKSAQKAYQNGIKRAQNGKWESAETELRRAVEEYPDYAVAWQALGQVLEAQDREAEAREAYDSALEADESYLSPYLKIALIAARNSEWQEVAAASNRVISLNPYDFPEAYYFQSVAKANLNDLDGAIQDARVAIERNVGESYPQVESLLGLVLASQGEYDEAADHLERYLDLSPEAGDREAIEGHLAEIERRIAAREEP